MGKTAKITSIKSITHDVYRIQLEKPDGVVYQPGQAVDISINKPGWEDKLRPFTFTSLPEDNFLEFTIKTYPNHKGVTDQIRSLKTNDELIVGEVFGDINYKGEGIFLAGGSGITPFLSIIKHLEKEGKIKGHKLIFGNKTSADIIDKEKFENLFGNNFINVLSDEEVPGYEKGFINAEIIKKNMENNNPYFYLCGPDPMVLALKKQILGLGVDKKRIVREQF